MRSLPGLVRLAFTVLFWVTQQSILLPQDESIAVLDLEGRGVSESEAISLSDRLRAALVRTDKLRIIERGQMEAVLREQDFSLTGCTSDECAVEVGELLGVTHMIAGTIGKVGSMFSLDFRVISVASGEIVQSISKDYQGQIEGLLGLMTVIANEFVGIKASEEAIAQKALIQEISIPTDFNESELSATNINSLTTVDEIYASISEDDLRTFSVGDSVYICDINIFKKYTWDTGPVVRIFGRNKSRLRVEIDGKPKVIRSARCVKKYAWLIPYRKGLGSGTLKIGDKVVAVSFETGIVKGTVVKIAWPYDVTLETIRIALGAPRKSTQLVDLRAIAMIRAPE